MKKKHGVLRHTQRLFHAVCQALMRRDLLLIALGIAAGIGIGIAYQSKNPPEVINKNLCAFEYGGEFYIPKMDDS